MSYPTFQDFLKSISDYKLRNIFRVQFIEIRHYRALFKLFTGNDKLYDKYMYSLAESFKLKELRKEAAEAIKMGYYLYCGTAEYPTEGLLCCEDNEENEKRIDSKEEFINKVLVSYWVGSCQYIRGKMTKILNNHEDKWRNYKTKYGIQPNKYAKLIINITDKK